jgi:hypothetical protein
MDSINTLVVLLLIGLCTAAYTPGEPGGPWSKDDLVKVRGKLYSVFRSSGPRPAAKALRLSFHDCLKYADGSGGCDGCLNWEGMEDILNITKYSYANPPVEVTNNKGLDEIVDVLEKVYKDPTYPSNVPAMQESLYESGKSRADLWSYAAIVAVEFSMEVNNIACKDQFDARVPTITCMHKLGDESCLIKPDRQFQFQHGRADCISSNQERPYITSKEESHPSPIGNGKRTIDFFKKDFDFNGRETVAIFGAHTLGRFSLENSIFPYIWTSSGTHTFNNDYYKVIAGEDRIFFDDKQCRPTGTAFGEKKVKTQWLAHSRKMDSRGGPVMWIHRSHICPPLYSPFQTPKHITCYENVEPGNECVADPSSGWKQPRNADEEDGDFNNGCEQYRIVMNRDEMAMNCEMGLYRDFEVTDGVIHGCPGLEVFNTSMHVNDGLPIWSQMPGQKGRQSPECKLQELAEPAGAQPLHKIIEEFAADQTTWINDFIPTMEKMMRNGYQALADSSVDRSANVVCPVPKTKGAMDLCYERSEPSNGPTFMIANKLKGLNGKVYQYNAGTGIYDFADQTGATNQLWKWSESGEQLYNMANNVPMSLDFNYEWIMEQKGDDVMLLTNGGLALSCRSAITAGNGCKLSTPTGFKPQLFQFIEV